MTGEKSAEPQVPLRCTWGYSWRRLSEALASPPSSAGTLVPEFAPRPYASANAMAMADSVAQAHLAPRPSPLAPKKAPRQS
ncbi:MAG: hypothetical protein GX937_02900 [Lentisphaerae bacterium]|jgi:hypothetical protein|nr:hypothetical protein [Lentisphaerota bacterium]